MSPSETVTAFMKAVEAKDFDAAIALLADDVTYDNVPMSAMTGPDAVRQTLEGFMAPADQVEWRVLRQDEAGGTVWNERVDRFHMGDKWIEVPVVGVWEVTGGLITLWRDYFDLATFTTQMA